MKVTLIKRKYAISETINKVVSIRIHEQFIYIGIKGKNKNIEEFEFNLNDYVVGVKNEK